MGHDLAQAALAARQAALTAADDAIGKAETSVSRLQALLDRRKAADRSDGHMAAMLVGAEERLARLHRQRVRLLAKLP
jgi:hypothetical protein